MEERLHVALSPPWTADEHIPCVRSAQRGELRLFAVLRGDATSSLSITISGAPNEHAPRKWHTVDVVSSARTIEVYDGKGDYVTSSRGESCNAECPLPAFSHSISLALDSVSLCLKFGGSAKKEQCFLSSICVSISSSMEARHVSTSSERGEHPVPRGEGGLTAEDAMRLLMQHGGALGPAARMDGAESLLSGMTMSGISSMLRSESSFSSVPPHPEGSAAPPACRSEEGAGKYYTKEEVDEIVRAAVSAAEERVMMRMKEEVQKEVETVMRALLSRH